MCTKSRCKLPNVYATRDRGPFGARKASVQAVMSAELDLNLSHFKYLRQFSIFDGYYLQTTDLVPSFLNDKQGIHTNTNILQP